MKINKLIIKRFIYTMLLIGTFTIIFIFSNQNGSQSGGLSQGFLRRIISLFTNNQGKIDEFIYVCEPTIRKIAHFSIYALAGIWSMCLLNTFKLKDWQKITIGIIIILSYAIGDEFHQSFISARSAEARDVLIDTMGGTFGNLLSLLIVKMIEKKNITRILQKY